MSFRPERGQLRGLSYEVAELYGKPHIMAYYRSDGVRSHRPEEGARCAVCGKPVGSVHHCPPLSKGRAFVLRTERGEFALKPALFALCGSGTTGCHDGFHGGARYKAEWVWRSDEYAEAWWSGELLESRRPHGEWLYDYGYWEIHDLQTGLTKEVRS